MEESHKKRKRPSPSSAPSHPFAGIFTRSRFQIYLHSNRSSRTRTDASPLGKHQTILQPGPVGSLSKNHFQSLHKRPRKESTAEKEVGGDFPTDSTAHADDCFRVLVKDLRARRVFSSPSVDTESGLCGHGEEEEEEEEEVDRSEKMGEKFEDKEILKGGSERDNGVSNEFCAQDDCVLQSTPPDPEILGSRYDDGGHKVELQKDEALHDNDGKKSCGDSVAKSKAPNPRSRVKVFKAPGSVSYRRLLPYLMDIAKDDSCIPRKDACSNIKGQQVLVDKCMIDGSPMEGNACDSRTSSTTEKSACGGGGSTSSEGTTSSMVSIDAHKGNCTRVASSVSLVDECCSKPLVKEGNEMTEAGVSAKDGILNGVNPGLSSSSAISGFSGCCSDTKPPLSKKTKRTDGGFSGIIQNCNDAKLDLAEQDHQLDGDDQVDGDSNNAISEKTESSQCQINSCLSDTQGNGVTCDAEKQVKGAGVVLVGIGGFNEESISLTPPDASVLGRPEAYKILDNPQHPNRAPGKPLNGRIYRTNSSISIEKMDSSPNGSLGLSRCSRLKLFKAPSSFNCRRLVSYLIDVANHNSGAPGNGLSRKLEKSLEESPASVLIPFQPKTPMEKKIGGSHHMEQNTDDSPTQKIATLAATICSSNSTQPHLASRQHETGAPLSLSSQKDPEHRAMDAMSEKDSPLKTSPEILNSNHKNNSLMEVPLYSAANPKSFSVMHELPVDCKVDCNIQGIELGEGVKPGEPVSLSPDSPALEDSNLVGIPAHGSKIKGILKRTPRGCRGNCTCLNCASFRLHAERAFEFSKNQMQDAEEVALYLIEELSRLRSMLEKSADGSGRTACINQIKEACKKASEAEEIAKGRLNQMNYELNIHCRITCGERPRVTFANYFEEKGIPSDSCPWQGLRLRNTKEKSPYSIGFKNTL